MTGRIAALCCALAGLFLAVALHHGITQVVFASQQDEPGLRRRPTPTPGPRPSWSRYLDALSSPTPAAESVAAADDATDPDATDAVVAGSAVETPTPSRAPGATPTPRPQSLLAGKQMIVFYGSPISPDLGVLGVFPPAEAARGVAQKAAQYDGLNGGDGVLPALDLIYAQAQAEPTDNGLYLDYLSDATVERYIRLAERNDEQLILDLQIGRGDIEQEVRKVERFLKNPRVQVAIDPEYAVGSAGVPGQTPGTITGDDIRRVQEYLSSLVQREDLPPKVLVIHQYMDDTVVDGGAAGSAPYVDLVFNMDGYGAASDKLEKYGKYTSRGFSRWNGFNVFLQYDDPVLSEADVLGLSPRPDVIFYQ